jgi:hypothetical protein
MHLLRRVTGDANQRVLVTDFDEFAGIALGIFHALTLLIPQLDGADVIDPASRRQPTIDWGIGPSGPQHLPSSAPRCHGVPFCRACLRAGHPVMMTARRL